MAVAGSGDGCRGPPVPQIKGKDEMDWRTWATDLHALLNFELFELAGTQITPFTLVALLLLALLTHQISRGLQAGIERAARRRMSEQEGSVRVFQRLVHYLVLTVAAVVALQGIGIDLGALVAAGAVFAVGVGLAMQNLAQNFVSGIILLVERSIKPGDIVEVDGRRLKVHEMGIRSTTCRTLDGGDLIVPNSTLVQGTVENLTMGDRLIRVRCPVGVVYDADMAQVRRVLREAAEALPWRVPDQEPILLCLGFGTSSVDWEISVWARDPWRLDRLRTELSITVWDALKAARITIAFPQLDVHLDPPVSEALRLMGRSQGA